MRFSVVTAGVIFFGIFSMAHAQSSVNGIDSSAQMNLNHPIHTQTQSANGIKESQINSPGYNADKWYRDSAERNAIYREVFFMAENVIKLKVAQQH